jgi:large subunit ribosomal protein L9
MKVILTTDIETLGQVGDIVDVKPGYVRNFLFPKKFAIKLTPHNKIVMENRKKMIQKKIELEKMSAIEQKEKIEGITLTLKKKAGENDVLFGSVTTAELEREFKELGFDIERKKIHLEEPIKRLGNYTCKIKIYTDIEAEVKIEVEKEEEEES